MYFEVISFSWKAFSEEGKNIGRAFLAEPKKSCTSLCYLFTCINVFSSTNAKVPALQVCFWVISAARTLSNAVWKEMTAFQIILNSWRVPYGKETASTNRLSTETMFNVWNSLKASSAIKHRRKMRNPTCSSCIVTALGILLTEPLTIPHSDGLHPFPLLTRLLWWMRVTPRRRPSLAVMKVPHKVVGIGGAQSLRRLHSIMRCCGVQLHSDPFK